MWREALSEGYGELLESLKLIGYEERQKKELVFHKYEIKHDLASVNTSLGETNATFSKTI